MNPIIKKIISSTLKVSLVDENIAKERLAICQKPCKFLKNESCSVCGCVVEIKSTMDYNKNPKKFGRIEKTHCPKGKWPFIDDKGVRHENDLVLAEHYKNN